MTVRVKICGLSSSATMMAALDAGADYVGLVFFPNSPRHVSLAAAARLAAIAQGQSRVVALLVDPTDTLVKAVVDAVAPDHIQLHGTETPKRTAEIADMANLKVIKAIGVSTLDDAVKAADYRLGVHQILFDAKPASGALLPGGNGHAFDWQILSAGPFNDRPFMLSGGLTPQNVRAAIEMCSPEAVDVSSGVETKPGVKDPALIRAFIKAAKALV
jgi:phosphoribosylanthranilate isomerase